MKQATSALFLLLFAVLLLAASPARAGCTNPVRGEGSIVYNSDYHTPQFCNGTTWMSMSGGGPGSGPMTLISTQTASASASLKFTNLPTSYNTLFLSCEGLLMSSSSAKLYYRVGEGAGPTWETGANYSISGYWVGTGYSVSTEVKTNATDLLDPGVGSTSNPQSIKMYIDNVGSSTLYKNATLDAAIYADGAGWYNQNYVSYWNADTNPITGLEVVPSTGNIASGTCSLYGMN